RVAAGRETAGAIEFENRVARAFERTGHAAFPEPANRHAVGDAGEHDLAVAVRVVGGGRDFHLGVIAELRILFQALALHRTDVKHPDLRAIDRGYRIVS